MVILWHGLRPDSLTLGPSSHLLSTSIPIFSHLAISGTYHDNFLWSGELNGCVIMVQHLQYDECTGTILYKSGPYVLIKTSCVAYCVTTFITLFCLFMISINISNVTKILNNIIEQVP